jgi:hypothetical protein
MISTLAALEVLSLRVAGAPLGPVSLSGRAWMLELYLGIKRLVCMGSNILKHLRQE